jgi:hypothetical protein
MLGASGNNGASAPRRDLDGLARSRQKPWQLDGLANRAPHGTSRAAVAQIVQKAQSPPMRGTPAVRGSGARTVRLVLPFVVAVITGVIVWASQSVAVLKPEAGPQIDPAQQQLVNAVFAALGAMLLTLIVVRVAWRPKPRRSR